MDLLFQQVPNGLTLGGIDPNRVAMLTFAISGVLAAWAACPARLSADYKDIIAFVLLVAILSVRPEGLFINPFACARLQRYGRRLSHQMHTIPRA
ncbi:hypothetical protein [Noviherbaspirillum saxi]|uniref:hypothetical protein n=1 Tax=Noviherbaspirillum saxi TaxID=2320863 RepID=UPI002689C894